MIILGDWNDHFIDVETDQFVNAFLNFISDSLTYAFADMIIADGRVSDFSCPSWPSHLDHILISQGLFDQVLYVRTLRVNVCNVPLANF